MAVEALPPIAEVRQEACPVTGGTLLRVRALCDRDGGALPSRRHAAVNAYAAAIVEASPASAHPACRRWLARIAMRMQSADDPATRLDNGAPATLASLFQGLEDPRDGNIEFALRRESGWFGATTPYGAAYTAVQPDGIAAALVRLGEWHSLHKEAGALSQLVLWHQLICIHPFRDGNGRFARYASMATAVDIDHARVLGAYWALTHAPGDLGDRLRLAHHEAVANGRIDGVLEGLLASAEHLRGCLSRAAATADWTTRALPVFSERLFCGEALSRPMLANSMGRSQRVAERILGEAISRGYLVADGDYVRLRNPATP